MRVQIVTPLKMQWIDGYRKVFEEAGHEVDVAARPRTSLKPDIMLLMWADEETLSFINTHPKVCPYIVFVRRYEIFSFDLASAAWHKVDKVIMVNDYLAGMFKQMTSVEPEVVYNGIDPDKWTFKEHNHGDNVALVGFINQKKNIPLALQVVSSMGDPNKTLHIAGAVQCPATLQYIKNLAKHLEVRVKIYHHVDDINAWLDDKDYILSTAISEGCPNNVIEAMAKGIKPIVHNWPGALEQFGEFVFDHETEGAMMMAPEIEVYDSKRYRGIAVNKFGWGQYKRILDIVEGICGKS